MNRREYLAAATALVVPSLSGCAEPEAVLQMDEVSATDIASRASRDVSESPEASDILESAVTNGSTTATGRRQPLETERPFAFEGRYYSLSVTETGQREQTIYDIAVDYAPLTATPDEAAIEYDDLPDPDREAVDQLLPPPENRPEDEGFDFGIGRHYDEQAANQSVLVPQQEYDVVVYDGTGYRIQVEDGRAVTVSDYRYEAEEIAASADELATQLRSDHLFTLSGLSSEEREIVSDAIDGGYYEGQTTDAFESLVERFRAQSAIETDEWGGDWLVRFEGTVYWADLRHPESLSDS